MSENNRASVYVHINLVNGKKYFGITTQDPPEKRWKNGNGYYNNAHFMSAVKKYGWENFAHLILYRNIPIKIAKNIEEMLIREHMSHDPRFGYNHTHGGELEIRSDETRRKISEAMIGNNNGNGRRRPVEAIDPVTELRVYYFESAKSAERSGFHQGHICACCNGKYGFRTHKGYIWRYVEEVIDDDINSGQ